MFESVTARTWRKAAAYGRQHAVIHVAVAANMMDLIRGACGVRDGLIIGLPVTRLPCKTPPSVWRINFVMLPPTARTSHFIVKDQLQLSNSVSCLPGNLMKWEKRAQEEKQTAASSISASARWCANCLLSAEWKQVPVRTAPPHPLPAHLAPSPAQPRLTAPLHRWMPSDAVSRVMGSVFSSRALQQLLQRNRGTLHGWLVHIRNTAQALLFFFFFSFRCEVKSKTLCKVTYATQIYTVLFHAHEF